MTEDLNLVSKALGPLPIINRFLNRLRLDHLFDECVPCDDRRLKLAPAVGLGLLLRNVLVARQPLYSYFPHFSDLVSRGFVFTADFGLRAHDRLQVDTQ